MFGGKAGSIIELSCLFRREVVQIQRQNVEHLEDGGFRAIRADLMRTFASDDCRLKASSAPILGVQSLCW